MTALPGWIGRAVALGGWTCLLWSWLGAPSGAAAAEPSRRVPPATLQPVLALRVSPDDELLACSRGAKLHLYDLRGMRLAAELFDPALGDPNRRADEDTLRRADEDMVRSLAFDRSGRLLASGGYRTVRLWQRPRTKLVAEMSPGRAVRAAILSPDGTHLALGGADGVIEVRAVAAEKAPVLLSGHQGAVVGVAFAADSQSLFSIAEDGALRRWKSSGEADGAWKLPAVGSSLCLLQQQIAVGDIEGKVRLWKADLLDRASESLPAPTVELPQAGQAVIALSFAATDPPRLLAGYREGRARLWNLQTAAGLRDFGHDGPLTAAVLHPQGERVLTVGGKRALYWNAVDGALVADIKFDYRQQQLLVKAEGAANYAQACVGYRKRDLNEAEEALKRETAVVEGSHKAKEMAEKTLMEKTEAANKAVAARTAAEAEHQKQDVAFQAATAQRKAAEETVALVDAKLKRINTELAQATGDTRTRLEQELSAARTERQQQEKNAAAAVEAFRQAERGFFQTRNAYEEAKNRAQQPERELKEAQIALMGAVNFIATAAAILEKAKAAAPAAQQALTAAEAFATEQMNHKLTREKALPETQRGLTAACFSADGAWFVIGDDGGSVLRYESERGTPMEALESGLPQCPLLSAASNGQLLAVAADGGARRWQVEDNWRLLRTIGRGDDPTSLVDRVLSLDFSPDGSLLATAGGEPGLPGELKLWNPADGSLVRTMADTHGDAIYGVRFSPDGQWLATAGADREIRIYRVADGRLLQTLAGHAQPVFAIAWPADGKTLASAAADPAIKIWDLQSGAALRTMRGDSYQIGEYRRPVTSLNFVGDTEHFIASGGDRTVRLHRSQATYDVRAYRDGRAFFHSAAATSDGKWAFGGDHHGVLHVWYFESAYRLASFHPQAPATAVKPQ